MTIGNGSQSHLNNRNLHRDDGSGHGFDKSRGNDFRLLPQILISTDDNPDDPRRLHHPSDEIHQTNRHPRIIMTSLWKHFYTFLSSPSGISVPFCTQKIMLSYRYYKSAWL